MADRKIPPPSVKAQVDDPATTSQSPSSKNSSTNMPAAEHLETGPDPDLDLTLWQSVKKYRRVVFYSLGITSAILMYGYDYVIIGTISAMPSFQ